MRVRITIATPGPCGTILDTIVCQCDQHVRVICKPLGEPHYRDAAELNIGDVDHYKRIIEMEEQ